MVPWPSPWSRRVRPWASSPPGGLLAVAGRVGVGDGGIVARGVVGVGFAVGLVLGLGGGVVVAAVPWSWARAPAANRAMPSARARVACGALKVLRIVFLSGQGPGTAERRRAPPTTRTPIIRVKPTAWLRAGNGRENNTQTANP